MYHRESYFMAIARVGTERESLVASIVQLPDSAEEHETARLDRS